MPSKANASTFPAKRPEGWTLKLEKSYDMRNIYWLAGDNRWLAKLPVIDPDTGRVVEYYTPKNPKLEVVIARRDEYLAARDQGRSHEELKGRRPKAEGMLLAEWVEDYKSILRTTKSDSTADGYGAALVHPVADLGHIPLPMLRKARIEQWVADEKEQGDLSYAQINLSLKRLKTCLKKACETERHAETGISVSPAADVDPIPGVTRRNPLEDYVTHWTETNRLVAAAGEHYLAALPRVATDAGLRRGEIAGLHWGDVDLERGTLTVRWHVVTSGKGAKRKTIIQPGSKTSLKRATIYLSEMGVAALREARDRLHFHARSQGKKWRAGQASTVRYNRGNGRFEPYVIPANPVAPEALVFPMRDGDLYQGGALAKWFNTICKRAGITTKTLHSLRHDCATFLLTADPPVPLAVVSAHMRHANTSITATTYSHLINGQERMAANTMTAIWKRAEVEGAAVAV